MQRDQFGIVPLELFGRDGTECAVEVIDAFYEVPREALDGEVFCGVDFAFCAVLQVAEVGY
jgi:hypothetical protein